MTGCLGPGKVVDMSIKCGSCKDRHASVNAVKECYAHAKAEREWAEIEYLTDLRADRAFAEALERRAERGYSSSYEDMEPY